MNTKMLLAALAATVFYFFGGWLIYGMLMMDYYASQTTFYEGLQKTEAEMNWPMLILYNLAWGFLAAYICEKTNSRTLMSGFLTTLVVGFLVTLSINASYMAFFNLYTKQMIITDLVISTLFMAAGGGIVGLILGTGNKG